MQAEDLLGLLSRKGRYTEWFKRLQNIWMNYCSVVCFRKSLMIFLHDPTLLLPTSLRGFFSFANYEIIEPCNPTGKGPERERESPLTFLAPGKHNFARSRRQQHRSNKDHRTVVSCRNFFFTHFRVPWQ